MPKVMLVEDDAALNDTMTNYLRMQGYEVCPAYDGIRALEMIDHSHFDVYVIDINVPGSSGLDLVRYIRQKDLSAPVVMITASIELANLKMAYANGCSDYIKKPFYLEELGIRINKLVTGMSIRNTIVRVSDSICYDFSNRELSVNGVIKRLRKKEGRLLHILLKNVNKTLTVQVIEDYVWENEIKDSYPLRQLVNELKRYFDDGQKYIHAERGIGYRFEAKPQT